MAVDYGTVAVLMGGRSAERHISLQSGHAVLEALTRSGVRAYGMDTGSPFLAHLGKGAYARAFIALHGPMDEDGKVQGALEVLGLPYTGSGVLASALAMDKPLMKCVWRSQGLPTPDWMELGCAQDLGEAARRLGLPLVVKPVGQGSSYGVTCVHKHRELKDAWDYARQYDARVMAERWVEGMELTAAIVGERQLPLISLHTPRRFYDHTAKYESAETEYRCPCGLPPQQEETLRALALRAFQALGARGWGRVDFILGKDGTPALLELNTVPGLTRKSLVPMAAQHVGMDFDALALAILATSCTDTAAATAASAVLSVAEGGR